MPKAPSLRILTQFIKDLSFENPSYTDSARSTKPPNIDLGIDVQARTISQDTYEVTLNFSARAVNESEDFVFIALRWPNALPPPKVPRPMAMASRLQPTNSKL